MEVIESANMVLLAMLPAIVIIKAILNTYLPDLKAGIDGIDFVISVASLILCAVNALA